MTKSNWTYHQSPRLRIFCKSDRYKGGVVMLDLNVPVRFFIGTNTPGGFVGFLEDFYDARDSWRAYLLKGSTGIDKTALLSRINESMTEHGQEVQAIICANDPDSLDGLIFPDIRVCILNADLPHSIEPKCYGAVEQIVNFSAYMNTTKLYKRTPEIIESAYAYKNLIEKCQRFLKAAASLLADSWRIANECTDETKIRRNASRIAVREFSINGSRKGHEKRRFLSAITPDGEIIFHETIQHLCTRIYSIEDEHRASARLLINELRMRALDSGLDVLSCYCPLFPHDMPEHLLIPSIGLGFITSNTLHKADYPVYRRIHAARFTDAERLRMRRQLLSFNRRAARELVNEAVSIAAKAKTSMDQIRQIYARHTDHQGASLLTDWVISELKELSPGVGEKQSND